MSDDGVQKAATFLLALGEDGAAEVMKFLGPREVQKIGGDKVKLLIKVRNGIESEVAKKIQRFIKDSKLKVQVAIQGDAVRITGAKRDDLQAAMARIKQEVPDIPLSFNNFRD